MRKLLIDGTILSEKIDGLTRYALNIIVRLDYSNLEATLLTTPSNDKWAREQTGLKSTIAPIAPIGPKRDWAFYQWLQKHQNEYDLFFEPSNQFPSGVKIPSLFVIHDVIYEEFPEQLGRLSIQKKAYLHHVVRRGLKHATKVVCVSSFTKEDVIRYHGDSMEEKMIVVGEGWEHLIGNAPATLPIEGKYFFYLGSSRGHKNVRNLLHAIDRISNCMRENKFSLIISGRDDNYKEEDKQIMLRNKDIIRTTGWISDEEVQSYFMNAEAFVFPSLSEGFGIPLLEAFYYGIPVLCSNKASLPEVAADAAIYFNPHNVDDIADCLTQIINKTISKEQLLENGKKRLEQYSWQKAADRICMELNKMA